MRRGRPIKPLITLDSVVAALKSLDYSSQSNPEFQSLKNLLLVDFRLQHSARPSAENIRLWMLQKIIVEFITTALNQNRHYFSLSSLNPNSTRDIVIRQLQQCFQTDSEYLKGWSMLYVRYVRPELYFSMQELSQITHTHTRSLQRYQETATLALQDMLTEAEWQIRKTQQQSYLKSQIPEQIVELFGRDHELETILSHFEAKFLKPVVISGETGIGKSAFAAYVAHYLVDHFSIDYLLWLKNPPDITYIPNKIWDTLLPYPTQEHWCMVLENQTLLLVIDGADYLDAQTDEWAELLVNLQAAFVIIINPDKLILDQSVYHIELPKLSQADSEKLIVSYLSQNETQDINVEEIAKLVGGNPRNLLHAIQARRALLDNFVVQDFYDVMFNRLTYLERVKIVLSQVGGGDNSDIIFSQAYIQAQYDTDLKLREETQKLIETFLQDENASKEDLSRLLDFAFCEWLELNSEIVKQILLKIDLTQVSVGNVHQWRNIFMRRFGLLTQPDESALDLSLQYGIVLRRIADPIAESFLQDIVQLLGRNGEFGLQTHAMYQLGLAYQSRGEFVVASDLYEHILRLSQNYPEQSLIDKVMLQLARIAIAQQNAAIAIDYLNALDMNRGEVFVLFCEARLIQEDFTFLFGTIPQYLMRQNIENNIRAALHTILGRAYQQQNRTEEAIVQFTQAVSFSERESNRVDIARARNNLGSSYLTILNTQNTSILDELEALFIDTQNIQREIKDVVGLEASKRNLRILRQHRIRGGR